MPDEVLERLDKLIAAVKTKDSVKMWGAKDMAEWFGLSEGSIKTVVDRPGFPASINPTGSPGGGSTQTRWFSDEVIEWARLNRGTLPKARGRRRSKV